MTNSIAAAREISDRRMALLRSLGEDVRRTAAWQDACAERRQIEALAYVRGER